ncbi:MAG: Flp pilus assembly protein TadB [Planctomycetota bacterium]|jgi:Flp pilus assembly protein TadB
MEYMASITDKKTELQKLIHSRDTLINGMFYYALGLVAVFGVPAGIAVYVGKYLIGTKVSLVISLLLALVLSWTLVMVKYSQLSKKTLAMDNAIQSLRAEIQEEEPVASINND